MASNIYTYTTSQPVTAGTRSLAYATLGDMLVHFNNLGINLISIVRNADNTISVATDTPIRPDYAGFWFLPVAPVITQGP